MRRRICILSSFRVADRFGPGPEAVAEGRASGQGVCFSAPLATNLGPGPEAVEGAQVEAWLEEPAAAFGSGGSCWRSQECFDPSLSRMLCRRLCLTFAEKKTPGMERIGPTPTAFDRPAGPARAEQEEHLLQQQKAIAAGLDMCGVRQTLAGRLLLPYWTRSTPSFAP